MRWFGSIGIMADGRNFCFPDALASRNTLGRQRLCLGHRGRVSEPKPPRTVKSFDVREYTYECLYVQGVWPKLIHRFLFVYIHWLVPHPSFFPSRTACCYYAVYCKTRPRGRARRTVRKTTDFYASPPSFFPSYKYFIHQTFIFFHFFRGAIFSATRLKPLIFCFVAVRRNPRVSDSPRQIRLKMSRRGRFFSRFIDGRVPCIFNFSRNPSSSEAALNLRTKFNQRNSSPRDAFRKEIEKRFLLFRISIARSY